MTSLQHAALRTADIDRAAAFYIEVFGARWQAAPWEMRGSPVDDDEPLGPRFRLCFLSFPGGGAIELFQFLEPAVPTAALPQSELGIMHIALTVDDVQQTVARVLVAGGTKLTEPIEWADGVNVCYVRDVDGNVVELLDADLPRIIALTVERFPDADPARRRQVSRQSVL